VSAASDALAASVQAVTEALRVACVDPADAIRALSTLAAYAPAGAMTTILPNVASQAGIGLVTEDGLPLIGAQPVSVAIVSTAPIGLAISTLQSAVAALCRRAALTSLARACAGYAPTSSDDAVSVCVAVVALFDAEILVAADAEDDASYQALRQLRTAVVADLVTRAAQLPSLVTVRTAVPMPALALAYRLYRDATRADDLAARSGAQHPAFLPTSFRALSA